MPAAQLLKRPSAFLPIGMPLAALCVVAAAVGLFDAGREPDEGPAAHLFQFTHHLELRKLRDIDAFVVRSLAETWAAAGPATTP
jgi:hypothetical protein